MAFAWTLQVLLLWWGPTIERLGQFDGLPLLIYRRVDATIVLLSNGRCLYQAPRSSHAL